MTGFSSTPAQAVHFTGGKSSPCLAATPRSACMKYFFLRGALGKSRKSLGLWRFHKTSYMDASRKTSGGCSLKLFNHYGGSCWGRPSDRQGNQLAHLLRRNPSRGLPWVVAVSPFTECLGGGSSPRETKCFLTVHEGDTTQPAGPVFPGEKIPARGSAHSIYQIVKDPLLQRDQNGRVFLPKIHLIVREQKTTFLFNRVAVPKGHLKKGQCNGHHIYPRHGWTDRWMELHISPGARDDMPSVPGDATGARFLGNP